MGYVVIKVGDVIQTTLCARKDYIGRKMRVIDIQEDVEPDWNIYSGVTVKKDGKEGRTHIKCTGKQVIN